MSDPRGEGGASTEGAREERAEIVRHEEELRVETRPYDAGTVRARKRVEREPFDEVFDREVEYFDELERLSVGERDSGEVETLPDGSVSIPVFEERLVVSKQLVVRERVVVRKRTVSEQQRVQAELRKERVEVDVEGEAS